MKSRPKFEVLRPLSSEHDPCGLDAFDEGRVQQDLAKFSRMPGMLEKYIERLRIRFQKANERAVLERWIEFYQSGERLIGARTAMERQKSEFLQLGREHQVREAEKTASLANHQADTEEHQLRRDKAAYQRRHVERYVDGSSNAGISEDEEKLNEAQERRQLDARWELHESLRALHNLIELQHWRREQRDRILRDRSLSPEEQSEDLQFVDDLYSQKRAELTVDTRIFEER